MIFITKIIGLLALATQQNLPWLDDQQFVKNATTVNAATPYDAAEAFDEGVRRLKAAEVVALQSRAETGDPSAQTILGRALSLGIGITADDNKSLAWLKKSAEAGDSKGEYFLGVMYDQGRGGPRRCDKAFYWWLKSAQHDFVPAQKKVAGFYARGECRTRKRPLEAMSWHRKAAEQGDAEAQYLLAIDYDEGIARPLRLENHRSALQWILRSAGQGYPDAMFRLGTKFEQGHYVLPDSDNGIYWLQKAADAGNAKAMAELGMLYEKGRGLEQDYSQAVKLYQRAADRQLPRGQFDLAFMYQHGKGVTQDPAKAIELYEKAAASLGMARYNLALLYSEGEAIPIDVVSALMWASLAMDTDLRKRRGDEDDWFVSAASSLKKQIKRDLRPSEVQHQVATERAQRWKREHQQ